MPRVISGTEITSSTGTDTTNTLIPDTITIGQKGKDFSTGVSEYDTGATFYDLRTLQFGVISDKRLNLIGIPNNNPQISASGMNTPALLFFGGSYIDAQTTKTASTYDMTIIVAFTKLDECDTILGYNNGQPNINCTGGFLNLESVGNFSIDTGVPIDNGTPYILTVQFTNTSGYSVRLNGVEVFTTNTYSNILQYSGNANIGAKRNDLTKYFNGFLGNILTAPYALDIFTIMDIEAYLFGKFQIPISPNPFIAGNPFSGCLNVFGMCNIYGRTNIDNITFSTAYSTGNVTINGNLLTSETTTINSLTSNTISTKGLYYEGMNAATVSSTNVYNLDYSNGGIFYIGGVDNPTANFSVNISNIQTDTDKSYTVSLVYYQTVTTYYCNAVRATDASGTYVLGSASSYVTPLYSGGTPFNAITPNLVIQTFTILSIPNIVNSSVRYVISSVSPYV